MRGLNKTAPDGAYARTDEHGESMTESAQWGRFIENYLSKVSGKNPNQNTQPYNGYKLKLIMTLFLECLKIASAWINKKI